MEYDWKWKKKMVNAYKFHSKVLKKKKRWNEASEREHCEKKIKNKIKHMTIEQNENSENWLNSQFIYGCSLFITKKKFL